MRFYRGLLLLLFVLAAFASLGSQTPARLLRERGAALNAYQADSTPDFGYPLAATFSTDVTEGVAPLTVQFTDSTDPGPGVLIGWHWDFGDGFYSDEQNPHHTYTMTGSYGVRFTVTDDSGITASVVVDSLITVLEPLPQISLLTSPSLVFGSIYIEEQSEYQSVIISNPGNTDLQVTRIYFSGSPSQFELLSPNPDSLLAPGETDALLVRFNPQTSLPVSDTLVIINNSANAPQIRITLNGTGLSAAPQAPQNLQISLSGSGIVLNWDPVTLNLRGRPISPDYYFVYVADRPDGYYTYHGFASTATYPHPYALLASARAFYRVSAVKLYPGGSFPAGREAWLSRNLLPGMSEAEVQRVLGSFLPD